MWVFLIFGWGAEKGCRIVRIVTVSLNDFFATLKGNNCSLTRKKHAPTWGQKGADKRMSVSPLV